MSTKHHLLTDVLKAVADYEIAELSLSKGYSQTQPAELWQPLAEEAKRRAAQAAVSIDGLVDRFALEFGISKTGTRIRIEEYCSKNLLRPGALGRIAAVANAYKHLRLDDERHPIKSWNDVLVVGAGFGEDQFGVGKLGGVEVLIKASETGETFKFLGDVPSVLQAFVWLLQTQKQKCPEIEAVLNVQFKPHP